MSAPTNSDDSSSHPLARSEKPALSFNVTWQPVDTSRGGEREAHVYAEEVARLRRIVEAQEKSQAYHQSLVDATKAGPVEGEDLLRQLKSIATSKAQIVEALKQLILLGNQPTVREDYLEGIRKLVSTTAGPVEGEVVLVLVPPAFYFTYGMSLPPSSDYRRALGGRVKLGWGRKLEADQVALSDVLGMVTICHLPPDPLEVNFETVKLYDRLRKSGRGAAEVVNAVQGALAGHYCAKAQDGVWQSDSS